MFMKVDANKLYFDGKLVLAEVLINSFTICASSFFKTIYSTKNIP